MNRVQFSVRLLRLDAKNFVALAAEVDNPELDRLRWDGDSVDLLLMVQELYERDTGHTSFRRIYESLLLHGRYDAEAPLSEQDLLKAGFLKIAS